MLKFYAITNGQGVFVSNASRRSCGTYRNKVETFVTTDLRQVRLFTNIRSCQITLDKVQYAWRNGNGYGQSVPSTPCPFADCAQVVEFVFENPTISAPLKALKTIADQEKT
jgi:hypothetical protein